MNISGKDLRLALKSFNITQEEAAVKLGRSRQTINTWLSKAEIDDDIIRLVKTKLGIDLPKYVKSWLFNHSTESHGDDNVDYYKNKIIKLQDMAIKDKQEIIELQRKLLDKSLSPDKDIVDDKL